MSESTVTNVCAAHRAHGEWRAEHEGWLDDVELWLEEYRRAASDLDAISERMRALVAAVVDHAAAIESHEMAMVSCEHELVGLHALGLEVDPGALAHERRAGTHAAERIDHDRLKAKVRELMALVRRLDAATLAGPRSP